MLRSNSGEFNLNDSEDLKAELEIEKRNFLNLVKEKDISSHSSYSFWNHYQTKLPLLSEAARKILNIAASSASIERFFSICGVVCTQRRGNMSPDMIIKRSMLKVNLQLLEESTE